MKLREKSFPVVLGQNAVLIVLLALQLMISVKMSITEHWSTAYGIAHLTATSISLVLLLLLWLALLSCLPRRLALTMNILFAITYLALQAYHWARHEPFTFLMLYKNGENILAPEAIEFAVGNIPMLAWIGLALLIAGFFVLQRRFDVFGSVLRFRHHRRWLAGLLLANVAFAVATPGMNNEYYEFLDSAYQYLKPEDRSALGGDLYPYVVPVPADQERNISKDPDRPHVFIVMLESFSAYYMDRVENGKVVTPFLDRLKNHGIFVSDFFSASVETSKGQFATLCSVYPSYRTNVFTSYTDNTFRCLSHILKENGYTNVFMKAYHSLDFENTGNFVMANAFDHAHGMDEDFVTKKERKKHTIGWGIQDDIFYKKTFQYLDGLHKEMGQEERFFVTTMSVTNHMMFDDIPKSQRYIYPKAKSHHENYTNSMHLTDKYLQEFFSQLAQRDYLKNSLVVVLGDNGFPMGQHRNNFHNTKTAYNELFKMPLLILWDGRVEPKVIQDRAYSQLDVAPTILDILGIETTHHFVGQSILNLHPKEHFVPLIQPFDGTYLASIRSPYKLVWHQRTGKERLYNLKDDPGERKNLVNAPDLDQRALAELREDIQVIRNNETLLLENRIYPSHQGDDLRVRIPQLQIGLGEDLYLETVGNVDKDSVFQVEIRSLDPSSGTKTTKKLELTPLEPLLIPANLLGAGVNRIAVAVLLGGEPQHSVTEDVYVQSPATELVSALPVEGHQGWGDLRINATLQGARFRIGGESFGFGLGTHASSEHKLALGGQFSHLYTGFGLDDESVCGDGAVFEVWADGKQLFESERLLHGTYRDVWLSVSGYQELKLVTREGASTNCDHANWINPVLYRAAATQWPK